MLFSMKGLVLRETQAGDKGRFIDILTEELGVVTFLFVVQKNNRKEYCCYSAVFICRLLYRTAQGQILLSKRQADSDFLSTA